MESSSSSSSFSVTSFFWSPTFGIVSTNNNDYCCIYYYTVSYCGTRSDQCHIFCLSLHCQREISHFVAMVLHLLITIIISVFITMFTFLISTILYTISIMFHLEHLKWEWKLFNLPLVLGAGFCCASCMSTIIMFTRVASMKLNIGMSMFKPLAIPYVFFPSFVLIIIPSCSIPIILPCIFCISSGKCFKDMISAKTFHNYLLYLLQLVTATYPTYLYL